MDLTWFLLCGFGGVDLVDLCVDLIVCFWAGGFWWLGLMGILGLVASGLDADRFVGLVWWCVCWFGWVDLP